MTVEGLHRDLLAIPGVADAVVEGGSAAPTGVRLRLEVAADPAVVGTAVQRILEARGLSSRLAAPQTPVLTVAPEPPEPEAEPMAESAATEAEEGAETTPRPDAIAGLAALTVEESASEVLVVATSSAGHRFSRRTTQVDEAGVAAAVVAVVGAMIDGRPPRLVAVTDTIAEGAAVVTVVVERRDGTRVAGAAPVRSGRPYAVARATWSALRG
jgi:hypothetical protein